MVIADAPNLAVDEYKAFLTAGQVLAGLAALTWQRAAEGSCPPAHLPEVTPLCPQAKCV